MAERPSSNNRVPYMRPTSEIVQEATKAQSYALMDETYNRMKQSANRIAFVLGIDRPLLD